METEEKEWIKMGGDYKKRNVFFKKPDRNPGTGKKNKI